MSKMLNGLSRRLVDEELLNEENALQAQEGANAENVSLVSYLVSQKLVNATAVATAAASEFGVPFFNLDAFDKELLPKDKIDEKLTRKHKALPLFARGTRLFVAIADPMNFLGLDEIKFNTGLTIDAIIVEDDKLEALIEDFFDETDDAFDDMDDELEDLENLDVVDPNAVQEEAADAGDDTPVVKFVNQMLLSAIKKGASDLHFEPYEKSFRVRFRVDGVLKNIAKPPLSLSTKITARLKVMSGMDISERRIPQDGRIKLKLSAKKSIDFRVNTCPTLWGEKLVLRILDSSSAQMGIDALGYEDVQKELYMDALGKPQGMILVTGPTGSGKTVSLYTGLNILNVEGVNISTAEDPVEINLEGINQVNVNNKVGMDFGNALRAFLRQDPDIIMVGEIRDLDTASIAIKAAQTGHMVMSTLHTNSAAETITRLQNMGVAAFNIATSVNLIIAQRLARKLCSACKKPTTLPDEVIKKAGFTPDLLEGAKFHEPVGCPSCNEGYKGRVGVYEVVKVTPPVSKIIMEEGNAIDLNEQFAKEGFNDLRRSGLLKVALGVTSLQEINRITTQ